MFLDFTRDSYPAENLPACKVRCDFRTSTVGAGANLVPGDVPACVWHPKEQMYTLRFRLYYRCEESQCPYRNQWHLFHQMTSLKIAHILGVPLSEVKTAFLYWFAEAWPQPASFPRLQSFLVKRKETSTTTTGFFRRRLETSSEPWYVLHIAFRVDSSRIDPGNDGVKTLEKNDNHELELKVGIAAEVLNYELTLGDMVAMEAAALAHHDFKSVYQFDGAEPNDTPKQLLQSEVGGVGGPERHRAESCASRCHLVFETANPLGRHRCATDCDCNGQRWCGHMGVCVGDSLPCRTEDQTTPEPTTTPLGPPDAGSGQTSPVTSPADGASSGGGEVGPNPSPGWQQPQLATTTTEEPLRQLSQGCHDVVIRASHACDREGCTDMSCHVMRATLSAQACHQDICISSDFFDRWLNLCNTTAVTSDFSQRFEQLCNTTTSVQPAIEEPVEVPPETIAGGLALTFLWVSLAAVGATMLMIAVKVLMTRPKGWCCSLWRDSIRYVRQWFDERTTQPRVVLVPPEAEAKIPPKTTPPGAPDKSEGSRKSRSSGPPSAAGGSSKPRPHTTPPSSRRGSPASVGSWSSWVPPGPKNQREAWTPEEDSNQSDGHQKPPQSAPTTARAAGRMPWQVPFLRNMAPQSKPERSTQRSSDSPDSGSSDPISMANLSKELRAVQKGAVLLRLQHVTSPKSLRKELSRHRENITAAERRRLFKELLLRWHPDKNLGDELRAAEMFQTLQEAKDWFTRDD